MAGFSRSINRIASGKTCYSRKSQSKNQKHTLEQTGGGGSIRSSGKIVKKRRPHVEVEKSKKKPKKHKKSH